ncbi:MAG: glycosyltransferase [Deltaproteobacteria bacterium]|jgi:spore maturation protein CgeB|nr:glycosyltransferase [Deltaproteobacteria bacterium]
MTKLTFSQETLAKNLAILSRLNPTLTSWLAEGALQLGPDPVPIRGLELTWAEDSSPVLMVDGLSQDSRVSPKTTTQKLLDVSLKGSSSYEGLCLFGLGSPVTLLEALDQIPKLSVYEPDRRVTQAVLALIDLSPFLETERLTLLCPWHKAGHKISPTFYDLITHQPSKRRNPAAWTGLKGLLASGAAFDRADPGHTSSKITLLTDREKPRLLIIPPYSGGSEPMGGFLLKAALDLSLKARLLKWPEALSQRALVLKNDPTEKIGDLMSASAREAAGVAQDFKPDLILNLAQVPLDDNGLTLLREKVPRALLAFWFVEDFNRFTYVNRVAPAYDLFFHIQGQLLDKSLRDWGLARAFYLPPAADASVFRPRGQEPDSLSDQVPDAFRATLSVAGAGYPNRRVILADLAEKFWPTSGRATSEFKIFGSGWEGCPQILKKHLFENGRRLSTEECALVYAGGQINLNLHSGDGSSFDEPSAFVNPRTFELASCASLQIVDNRSLLTGLFERDELEIIDQPSDLPGAILKHLNDPQLGITMGQKARQRVLNQHLYLHRLKFILECAGLPNSDKAP